MLKIYAMLTETAELCVPNIKYKAELFDVKLPKSEKLCRNMLRF